MVTLKLKVEPTFEWLMRGQALPHFGLVLT